MSFHSLLSDDFSSRLYFAGLRYFNMSREVIIIKILLDLLKAFYEPLWKWSRKRKVFQELRMQAVEGCKILYLMDEEAERSFNNLQSLIDKILSGEKIGLKYAENVTRSSLVKIREFHECFLKVLAYNIELLEKVVENPSEIRFLRNIALIFKEKGCLDMDDFLNRCPYDFIKILDNVKTQVSHTTAQLKGDLKKSIASRALLKRDVRRAVRIMWKVIGEELGKWPIKFGPKSLKQIQRQLQPLVHKEIMNIIINSLKT